MNFKRLAALALVVILALVSVGALATTEEEYEAQIAELEAKIAQLEHDLAAKDYVAEFDGGYVLATDAASRYEYISYMYEYYGYDMTGYEDYIKQDLVKTMVEDAIVQYEATVLGLDALTDEQKAEVTANADGVLGNYIEQYRSSFEGEDKAEEDIISETTAYLEQNGVTYDSLYSEELTTYVKNLVYAYVADPITITDEDARSKYGTLVEADEAAYMSAADYTAAINTGKVIYWRPEGYRNVKQVLVKFDSDQSTRYSTITSNIAAFENELNALETEEDTGKEPRTAEEINADLDAANAELDALYAELQPTADEVIAKFGEGTSIDELINTYGGDPGSVNEDGTTNTYAVSAECTSVYDPAFVEAAMSVSEIGGLSAATNGIYGKYIVYYDSDIESGALDYETVKDDVYLLALSDKQNTAYDAQIDAWVEELNVVYYMENFK